MFAYLVVLLPIIHMILLNRKKQDRDLLGVYFLMDCAILIMFGRHIFFDATYESYSNMNQLLEVVLVTGILSLYGGIYVAEHAGAKKTVRSQIPTYEPSLLTHQAINRLGMVFAVFCVLFGLAAFNSMGSSSTGVLDSFFGERLIEYGRRLESGDSFTLTTVVYYLFGIPCTLITVLLLKKRYATAAFVFGVTIMLLLAEFKTRLWVIMIVSLPAIYFNYYVRKLGVLLLLAGVCCFAAMHFALNVWRGNGVSEVLRALSEQDSDITMTQAGAMFTADLSPTKALRDMVEQNRVGALPYEHGLTYVYTFLTMIPRSVWPNKPLVSFAPRRTRELFGSLTSQGGQANVQTFTPWGEGLAQFGLAGVALNLFLYGIVVAALKRAFERRREFRLIGYCFGVEAAYCLRGELGAIVIFGTLSYLATEVAVRFAVRRAQHENCQMAERL